ncbi:MAG: methyltransferase domain-containing protein [Oscillospiraceae bacterium]|nr:methyltransferase domain-containing protein [Oscillospiraceae bacterium]
MTNTDNGIDHWEALADDWDARMGEDGNQFHRELIRPATLRLLNPQPGERILDAACGNGIFSRKLAELGAEVVAFDYSPQMIAHAKTLCADHLERIVFSVVDAMDGAQVTALGSFDKAVSNMAVMDIADIKPLICAIHGMLKPGGVFVFSAEHPCFQTPGNDFLPDGLVTRRYIEPEQYVVQVFSGNDKQVLHWHRPLHQLLGLCFEAGFVLDGLEEPVFTREKTNSHWVDIPAAIIFRVRKI